MGSRTYFKNTGLASDELRELLTLSEDIGSREVLNKSTARLRSALRAKVERFEKRWIR